MVSRFVGLLSMALLISFPNPGLSQSSTSYQYTSFDVPASAGINTRPQDINERGDIVGRYEDKSGVPHGFLRSANGTFTAPIDFPGAANGTAIRGINFAGDMVGKFFDSSGQQHGFLRTSTRSVAFDVPASLGAVAGSTQPDGLNDADEIVGDYQINTPIPGYGIVPVGHGFLRSPDGSFQRVDFPGGDSTTVSGINNLHDIVGFYIVLHSDATIEIHGFLRTAEGTYKTVDAPASTGATDTVPNRINDRREIAGYYATRAITVTELLTQLLPGAIHGFVMSAGNFTTLDYPGVSGYSATFSINSSGVVVGDHGDAGTEHGYIATTVAVPHSTAQTSVPAGGVSTSYTSGSGTATQSGYASASIGSGLTPYATAVFSVSQNGLIVSEAGVPAAPPTTSARIFIDFHRETSGNAGAASVTINTGLAIVNAGTGAATVTYTLRNISGQTLSTAAGVLPAAAHTARFIDQLEELAPAFRLPADFATNNRFGTLELTSTQPLSILALRLTANQRNDILLTSTPVTDLTASTPTTPAYFPQLADGGGYTTSLVLMNTSTVAESGKLLLFDDGGMPLTVHQQGGASAASFEYSIPPAGVFVFATDGSPSNANTGWAQLLPSNGPTPAGSGIFRLTNAAGTVVTESGVPATYPTTHARIYVDTTAGHDTGLALGNPAVSGLTATLVAFDTSGTGTVGNGSINLVPNGHTGKFAGQFVSGLPENFTGILDISSPQPFAALTLRSLVNSRSDFLMTTFPIADLTRPAPSPIVFPQIADGGPYVTQFILISSGGPVTATIGFFDDSGRPLGVGQ